MIGTSLLPRHLVVILLGFGLPAGAIATSEAAHAFTCGAEFRGFGMHQEEMRVSHEIAAGSDCENRNNFAAACKHFFSASAALDHVGSTSQILPASGQKEIRDHIIDRTQRYRCR